MKFGTAVSIAIVLLIISVINGSIKTHTAGVIFALLVFLLLASLLPWLAIPLGAIAILWEVLNDQGIKNFLANFKAGQSSLGG